MVERCFCKSCVGGSIPSTSSMGSTPYNFFSLSLQRRRGGENPPPNLSRQLGWFKRDHGTYPDVGSIPTRGTRAKALRHLVLLKHRAGETDFPSPAHSCRRSSTVEPKYKARNVLCVIRRIFNAGSIPAVGPFLKDKVSLWEKYA